VDPEASWRLKLRRAEDHFCHFKLRILGIQERQAYAVSEGFESYNDKQVYTWRLQMPPLNDPTLALLVGDVLFNVRSALDHLAVALVPPVSRTPHVVRSTQFPIFTCDIDERDAITGEHLHRRDKGRWDKMTRGMTPAALPTLKWLQPYQFGYQGVDPLNSSLAILSALQNADKHRQLTVTLRGIRESVGRFIYPDGKVIDYEAPTPPGIIGDGTVIGREPVNDMPGVKMEVVGSAAVFIGEGELGPYRECPEALSLIIRSGWACITKLEPFVAV
jgi:hypothetical protein